MPMFNSCGNLAEVLHFVLPVNAPGSEVLRTQQHARMAFESFHGIIEVVFTAYRQDNTPLIQVEDGAL